MKWILSLVVVGACGTGDSSAAAARAQTASDQLLAMQAKLDSLQAQAVIANQQLVQIVTELAELKVAVTPPPTSPAPADGVPSVPAPAPGSEFDPFADPRAPSRPKDLAKPTTAAERAAFCAAHPADRACLE